MAAACGQHLLLAIFGAPQVLQYRNTLLKVEW
jgi:hypothetical protein